MATAAIDTLGARFDTQEIGEIQPKLQAKSKEKVKTAELKRMTIALPPDAARMLELLSELQGVSQSEALRRAISTEAFIQREIKDGGRVLIQSPDNHVKELVFR
jgi:hypothetical protein